jgi:O-antigen/teichoic acid export membrane protein
MIGHRRHVLESGTCSDARSTARPPDNLARLVARIESDSPARTPLPEGTIPVAIGLFIAGVCSFAFFRVGKVALGSDEAFKPVVSMWFATFALAPGFFLPLEQELGRALSARRALGQGGRPVVTKVLGLGAVLAALVMIAILCAGPWLSSEYFGGSWVMVIALVVSIVSYAPAHLARGMCSGMGRFRAYSVVMGADGLVRIILCLGLAILGVKAVGWYGFAVALAPLLGVAAVLWKGQLRTDPGPASSWQEVTPNLGWLLLGSVMAAALVNAGPIATNLLAADFEKDSVTKFGYGVILARVPLFLFQAVQAALLPRLSRLAAGGEMAEFVRGFKRLMVAVLCVGAVGVVGAFILGPFAVDLLYEADLSRRTLAVLALGSTFYMLGLAIAQAVIALHGHAQVAFGWTVGMASFVIATWAIGGEVFRRVELGLLIGSAAAMVVFAVALRSRLRAGAVPNAGSVLEAITDMPFEA